MEETHTSPFAGYFLGEKLYKALVRHWYWLSMYSDVVSHCTACPQCAVVHSSGRLNRPPLHLILVQHVFLIVEVRTEAGNRQVVVFQDFLSKWPFVFTVPVQKAMHLARLLVEEVVSMFRVPESLLSDRQQSALPSNGGCVQAAGYLQAEHNHLPSPV